MNNWTAGLMVLALAFYVLTLTAAYFVASTYWEQQARRVYTGRQAEMQAAELARRHDIAMVKELGRQMLGTLRPGETTPDFEEQLPVQSPGADQLRWWEDEGDLTDPTDALEPEDPIT